MIPIYVISLPNEEARREHIKEQCGRFGLEAIFIDASDMRQATQADIEHLSAKPMHRKPKKQWWLSRGELGCALSHHRIYQQIVQEQHPYALILEDDAQFLADPYPLLQEANLLKIHQQYGFDVLLLGFVKILPAQLAYFYRRAPIKPRAQLQAGEQMLRFGTPWEQHSCGTVAYIISLQGAQKMLKATEVPCVPADDWLYFEQHHRLRILHSRPAFVLEALEKLGSTIRIEKADFLPPKASSVIIRSVKGYLKHFAMNYLGMKA